MVTFPFYEKTTNNKIFCDNLAFHRLNIKKIITLKNEKYRYSKFKKKKKWSRCH
jgi:hypothetical protein